MSARRKTETSTTSLSPAEARRLVLRAQGLDRPEPFGAGEAGALAAVEHLGYVQIDTIAVVERAHHHVLWSRVPGYRSEHLAALLAPGAPRLFEYWAHAAAFLPLAEFRFSLPRMKALRDGDLRRRRRDLKVHRLVLDRIRAEGPLQARDFEAPRNHRGGGWWEWKPAKRALEQLFAEGALMVRERRGFEKVFDLTERVLPAWVDTRHPTPGESARHLVLQTLRSFGLGQEPEMRYQRRPADRSQLAAALSELQEEGLVRRVRVGRTGAEPGDCFALAAALDAPAPAAEGAVRILSPFDNLVIQRKRLSRLFGFDYQLECYVPAPKRRYGYFVLPVLLGDRLVARLDAKADRRSRTLRLISAHFEEPRKRKAVLAALEPELRRFAAFNGCEAIEEGQP